MIRFRFGSSAMKYQKNRISSTSPNRKVSFGSISMGCCGLRDLGQELAKEDGGVHRKVRS